MTDPKLLPLPERAVVDTHIPTGVRIYGWTEEQVQSYARANVEASTEALRAEVDGARKVCEEVSSLLEKLETTYTCDSIIIDKCWRLLEEVTGD